MIILGLGSNIGDRLAHLRLALSYLQKIEGCSLLNVSPVYESDALLPDHAKEDWNIPFLNSAVSCKTDLSPEKLLALIKQIETRMGRQADRLQWAPRIIDIDILAWNHEVIKSDSLNIPHHGLYSRPFAFWPLADLLPDWEYALPNITEKDKYTITEWGTRFNKKAPFRTHQIVHRIDTPQLIGILNITPDSFSDGGKYGTAENALEQAEHLHTSGANIIDIGAESTRPGATTISPELEWSRLHPILETLLTHWKNKASKPKFSLDTRYPETAEKAIVLGIDWINDVTGLDNPTMRKIVAEANIHTVFMHHQGIPVNREITLPTNQNAIPAIYIWAQNRMDALLEAGIKKEKLIFDPGIGFGKSSEQSLLLIKNIDYFQTLGMPLLIGHSRKSFLNLFTDLAFQERDIETTVFSEYLAKKQVDYLRVHNVELQARALKISASLPPFFT